MQGYIVLDLGLEKIGAFKPCYNLSGDPIFGIDRLQRTIKKLNYFRRLRLLLDLQRNRPFLVIIVAIFGSLLTLIPGFDFAFATSEEDGSNEGGGEDEGDDGGDQPPSGEQSGESATQEEDQTADPESQSEDTASPQGTSSIVAPRPTVVAPSFPTSTPRAPLPTLIESPSPSGNFCKLFPFHPTCKTSTPTPTPTPPLGGSVQNSITPIPSVLQSPDPTFSPPPCPPFCPFPTVSPTPTPSPTIVAPLTGVIESPTLTESVTDFCSRTPRSPLCPTPTPTPTPTLTTTMPVNPEDNPATGERAFQPWANGIANGIGSSLPL
jgi:hypothetical protein